MFAQPKFDSEGALKHVSNVATATWILVISLHTWRTLFFGHTSTRLHFILVIIGSWSIIVSIPLIGFFVIQKSGQDPYFGISGFWCWISDDYQHARAFLEYMIMFLSAGISFILYLSILLKFRGNLVNDGWHMRFRRVPSSMAWQPSNCEALSGKIARALKLMMWFPCIYVVIIFPIALCRFLAWSGSQVPYQALIISDSIFILGGFMNVILFLTTRKLVSVGDLLPRRVPVFHLTLKRTSSRTSDKTTLDEIV